MSACRCGCRTPSVARGERAAPAGLLLFAAGLSAGWLSFLLGLLGWAYPAEAPALSACFLGTPLLGLACLGLCLRERFFFCPGCGCRTG